MIYRFTSQKFSGAVVFEFDDAGNCIRFDVSEAELDFAQKSWILSAMRFNIDEFKKRLATKTTKLSMVKINATFEMFWDRYDEKVRSSRKKALLKWNRMSQIQRDLAYDYIFTYERNLLPGTAKKYAESYLNAELWNN